MKKNYTLGWKIPARTHLYKLPNIGFEISHQTQEMYGVIVTNAKEFIFQIIIQSKVGIKQRLS